MDTRRRLDQDVIAATEETCGNVLISIKVKVQEAVEQRQNGIVVDPGAPDPLLSGWPVHP